MTWEAISFIHVISSKFTTELLLHINKSIPQPKKKQERWAHLPHRNKVRVNSTLIGGKKLTEDVGVDPGDEIKPGLCAGIGTLVSPVCIRRKRLGKYKNRYNNLFNDPGQSYMNPLWHLTP